MSLSPAVRIRLEKAATDNGFDVEVPLDGDWLGLRSSHAALRVWLTAYGDGLFVAALSQWNVWGALAEHGASFPSPLDPPFRGAPRPRGRVTTRRRGCPLPAGSTGLRRGQHRAGPGAGSRSPSAWTA